jgi:hypothetical protein
MEVRYFSIFISDNQKIGESKKAIFDASKIKTMKNLLTSMAVAALVIVAMPSCKKVSPRKLDGKWKVVKGTVSETSEDQNSSSSYNTTFDGTKETGTRKVTFTSGGNPINEVIDKQLTLVYEFSKDDDSFTITSTETGTESDLFSFSYFTKDALGFYIPVQDVEVKTSFTRTNTAKGIFSITGGAGDVKKNSQIVMQYSSDERTENSTIKYFTNATEFASQLYVADYTGGSLTYKAAPTTKSETSKSSGNDYIALIVNVDELKGGVMDISYSENSTYTQGSSTSKSSGAYKYTLEEE